MAGTIGESVPWPAQTVWANSITDSERSGLLERLKLPAETALGKWWITEFEDSSTPRLGTDEVYFQPSMDRGPVARAPIVVITYKNPWWAGPLAIILVLAVCGAGLILVRRYTGSSEENAQPDRPPPLPAKPQLEDLGRDAESRSTSLVMMARKSVSSGSGKVSGSRIRSRRL